MIFCSVQDAVILLTLFKYLPFLRTLLPWKQVLTVLFFYLYYLYCLSIFQRTCCFRFKSGCKGKDFIFNHQTFSEVFFVLFFKHNLAFSLCQFCKAFFSWKAGAKVHPFRIQSKYIKLFFLSFFERIC